MTWTWNRKAEVNLASTGAESASKQSATAEKDPQDFPLLGVTTGDPAGIGPEVSLRAVDELRRICRFALFGDAVLLRALAQDLGISGGFEVVTPETLLSSAARRECVIVDVQARREDIVPAHGSSASGEAAARNILECAKACLAGRLAAMVTAPLSKKYFNQAGYHFPGHTEFLAHLAGTPDVAMAFLSDRLRVVLATIHVPLKTAIESLTTESLTGKLEILLREFPRLGLPCRRIAVAGLNPHAGEGGLLGREEIERIEPAIRLARKQHPDKEIEGPVPADTLFHRAAAGEFDAVLALYHDQGLAPIKLLAFGTAVNVTLGLPFIRTSVDHGTAFDIAGKGLARPDGMVSAVKWALRLIEGAALHSK